MAFNSNTMEFFRRLENNGTGSSKLGKIITTSKTVGSISSGSILSSNITFPAFIDSLFGSGDDMAMDVSPVRFEESTGEYIVDPTIVSHREVDEDGNPVEPNFKIKLEVTPGSDLIECINIQKIVTTIDPETGDSVSKKITVSTIKTAQASAPSETGVNDFIITVPCTKEDAAADEVKLRVVAYEYIIAPGGPAKPTPLPDEKPSNGQPSKVVEIGVTFGALQLTKAKLTSTQSTPVTNVVTGTTIDFPLTGEVVIGEDELTMDDLVSLELYKDGDSTPVATATDPSAGDKVIYIATVTASASAPDRTVSVPYTLFATWADGTIKEAHFVASVVAKAVTNPTVVTCTTPTPTRTNVLPGVSESFVITCKVTPGDDGRTLADLGALTIDDAESGVSLAEATAAECAAGTFTYTLNIEADPTAPAKTVSRKLVAIAYWGESEADIIYSSELTCKVVAKEISAYTTCVINVTPSGEIPVSPLSANDFHVVANVVIGEDGLKKSDITRLSIQNTFDMDLYVSSNPTSGTIDWTDTLTALNLGEGTYVADYKLVAEWGDTKKIESDIVHVGVVPTVINPANITYTVTPTSPQTNITHEDDVTYTIACTAAARDEAKYITAAAVERFELVDAISGDVLDTDATGGSFTGSLSHTMYADVRATDRKTTSKVIAKVYWDESALGSYTPAANPTVTAPFDLVVVAKAPTSPTTIAVSSTTVSPASGTAGQAVSFPLTAEITFGDDGYYESEVEKIEIFDGSTVIGTSDPYTATFDIDDYTITAASTVGTTVTKTIKAVATLEDGKTFTSPAISLKVTTADVTKINISSATPSPQTNIEPGTTVTFPITGQVVIGGDGRTMSQLTSIDIMHGPDMDNLEILIDAVKDLNAGTITGDIEVTADYAAESHTVSHVILIRTRWSDGLSALESSVFTAKVVAKAPEKHVYVGIMHIPYEASLTYDEGMGADALTPIPAADMTDEKWPTPEAITADINTDTGHAAMLPLLCAGDGSPNPLITRSASWHIDPETEQWTEGSLLTEALVKETRDPVDVPEYAAEIHAGRQAFITSKRAFTLDSDEVAQMHGASGYLFDLSDQKEEYYCALTDADPDDPNDPGFTPSRWGLANVSFPIFIIPTEDFNKDFFTSGGYETELTHFSLTIDGIPYTAYFGKGGTADFMSKTYKVKISDKT